MIKTAISIVGAFTLLMSGLQPGLAGSRYSTPQPQVLSSDLASPWILQLRNKPRAGKPYSVGVSKRQKRAVRYQQPRKRKAVRRSAFQPHKPRHQKRLRRNGGQQTATLRPKPPSPKPKGGIDPKFFPQMVAYHGSQRAGTIVIDTQNRFLYLVQGNGMARRYGVGVGKPGFEWAGTHKVTRKAEWPSWRPPAQMIKREAAKGHHLPKYMEGGPANPLGARSLYLGSTLYRIHGTNQPWSIGLAVSSGCIRMRNEDVMDLYERVPVGAKVIVS